MAWIESHQELGRHPKTKRFARMTGISVPAAVGYLHFLWWWALDFAQDGDLSGYTDEDIADAMCWEEGSPETLMGALCEAGFLDKEDSGYLIHDWYGYAGKLIERREADRERKRNAQTFRKKSDGNPKESKGNITASICNRTLTVPNPTVPNQSIPPVAPDGATSPTGEDDGPTKADKGTANKAPSPSKERNEPADNGFTAFWSVYPRKKAKEAARKSWVKLKPDKALQERILSAVKHETQSDQWSRDDGRFIPHAATWLNQRRFDDFDEDVSSTGDWFVNDTPVSKDQFDFEIEHVKRTGAAARGWYTDERHFYCERVGEPCATSPPNHGQAHAPPS